MAQKFLIALMFCLALSAGIFALPRGVSAYAIINLNTLSADNSFEREAAGPNEKDDSGVERVVVRYKQRGALLAIFPVTFNVIATAYPNGIVELRYPWYSPITIDNEAEIEARAKVAVNNALKSSEVGSVKAKGIAEKQSFTKLQAEAVEKELRAVLRDAFENWGKDGDE